MPDPVQPISASPPTEASLREAALRHLARYSTTRAGLLRVLARRVDRWARAAAPAGEQGGAQVAAAKHAAETVVARPAPAGAVDDAAFAASRARSLHRAGRSSRAIAAHLLAKGVSAELAAEVPKSAEQELAAALLYASRRRMGPFRPRSQQPAQPDQRLRDLARLARAGFPAGVALHVLDLAPSQAEQLVLAARRELL